MKRQHAFGPIFVLTIFLSVSLGCAFLADSPAPTPTPAPLAKATVVSTSSQPASETLTSLQKQQLAKATVRILMSKKQGGKLVPFGTGSGTLVSADGLIITNAHVASPITRGNPEDEPDALVIETVDSEDQPPIPIYVAKLLAADGMLDLAVIQINQKLDGSPVKLQNLNLPFVKMGDSDNVRFGDPIYIFGFPGIGGETITYTSGSISGFDRMDPIGNRAWMKTDATIAGGNSGGLASNSRAEIVGVPTRLGTSSAQDLADCRRIVDTNGDGKIDKNDTCIPLGGFINAIRPINWVLPLLNSVKNGITYKSPYQSAQVSPTSQPPKVSAESFRLNAWATKTDTNNCPVEVVKFYPSGITKIISVFSYQNMTQGETWSYRWMLDGRQVSNNQSAWKASASGNCFSFSLDNAGKPLPDGTYKLEIYSGSSQTMSGASEVKVGGSGGPIVPGKSEVMVEGKVIDNNNGKGIPEIFVIVLNPGIDPDEWLQNSGSESDVYSYAQTDQNGQFKLPDPLERGESYGAVSGSKKLGYPSVTGFIEPKADDPDTISITIRLSK